MCLLQLVRRRVRPQRSFGSGLLGRVCGAGVSPAGWSTALQDRPARETRAPQHRTRRPWAVVVRASRPQDAFLLRRSSTCCRGPVLRPRPSGPPLASQRRAISVVGEQNGKDCDHADRASGGDCGAGVSPAGCLPLSVTFCIAPAPVYQPRPSGPPLAPQRHAISVVVRW